LFSCAHAASATLDGMANDPDVDARFLLANERTLLAWLRTGLALQAGGVALAQVGRGSVVLSAFGLALLALGAATAVIGYVRYRAAARAIRAGELPRSGFGPAAVTAAVVVLAAGLVIAYALRP
jgi:putative membrane protein